MREHLSALVREAAAPAQGLNVAREYLQARILAGLQRAGAMLPLAFHGGTALRFLYRTPRYSEDLDFALERAHQDYDLRAWLQNVRNEFVAEGYAIEAQLHERAIVHSAWIRFRGLPYELGLAPHRGQVLAIKLEVDTRPPAGAGLATTVVRRHVILHLQHHDRETLLAGKLHAVLQRPYLKGRDLYDLLWYLSDPDWPAPNLTMLNNALAQTDWPGAPLVEDSWRAVVRQRLQGIDWRQAQADVQPFLEQSAEAALLRPETFDQLLVDR
jgi:hypothetical protein